MSVQISRPAVALSDTKRAKRDLIAITRRLIRNEDKSELEIDRYLRWREATTPSHKWFDYDAFKRRNPPTGRSIEYHEVGILMIRKFSRAFELLSSYAKISASSRYQYGDLMDCFTSCLAECCSIVNTDYGLDLSEADVFEHGLIPTEALARAQTFFEHDALPSAWVPLTGAIKPDSPETAALMRLTRKLLSPASLCTATFGETYESSVSAPSYSFVKHGYFTRRPSHGEQVCHQIRASKTIQESLAALEEQGRMIDRFVNLEWYSREMIPGQEPSKFSTGSKRYFVQGEIGNRPVEALPDTGADMCLISKRLASELGLSPIPGTRKKIRLANRKVVQSPGMVKVPWRFSGESETVTLKCWILPRCVHEIILGSSFLNSTQTLTAFRSRIQSEFIPQKRNLRLQLVGGKSQQMCGYLNGQLTTAFPDTGSDAMLVSKAYAKELRVEIDEDPTNYVPIELADGTTAWTSGIVRDVSWRIGTTEIYCNFFVLDDLCVDVVLSNDYLFEFNVFSECSSFLLDVGLEEEQELWKLCNIRLISKYGQSLDKLETESLQDCQCYSRCAVAMLDCAKDLNLVTSPDAFSPAKIQRELARRDKVRDEIASLPNDRQPAASQDESERQHRWEELRRVHQAKWNTTTAATTQPVLAATNATNSMSARKSRWRRRFQALASS